MIGGERITNLYKGFYRSQLFINGVNIVLMNPITEIDKDEEDDGDQRKPDQREQQDFPS